MRKNLIFVFCLITVIYCLPSVSFADQKSWKGAGDASSWSDDANWYVAGAPAASDDVVVDITDASATAANDFSAKSLTLAGKKTSTVTLNNFVSGTIKPAAVTDDAVYNRKGGTLVIKGSAGKVTLKGVYRASKQAQADEPSFMFYAQ